MNSINLPEDCAKQWELILLLLSSEEKKIDKTSENEIDMMSYYYKNEGVRKILHQWISQMNATYANSKTALDTATKADDIALFWRQKGNDKFRSNDMHGSYKCYSKSVMYGRHGSQMFPLALANRSATLLRLKRFKDCLADVKLAVESGYPSEQCHKLYLREADCYIELNNESEARKSLARAQEHMKLHELSAADTSEFERNFNIIEKKLKTAGQSQDSPIELPGCYLGEGPHFVAASSALELRHSKSSGRYVVTNAEVQRGSVLFVEEPYAFVALPVDDAMPIVCETCCQSQINPVPCWECSRSIYCSEECRRSGWDSFHRWECVGAQSLLWPTIGIAHLALRVLLVSTSKGFPTTKHADGKPVSAADVFGSYSTKDNIDIYRNCNKAFFRVFHLVTNFDKMNNTDYIQYALTAVMLTIYLDAFTKFFEFLPTRLPFTMSGPQLRLFVASLLLRHLGQLVCNGHAVMALHGEGGPGGCTEAERELRLATAIYPSASMMNHSCDPDIISSFHRCRLVVKASRALLPGAPVHNCYGPQYTREPAPHRRAQLRAQYLFTCSCAACLDPERRDFVLLFNAYSCHLCKGPVLISNRRPLCKQCRSTDFKLDQALAALDSAEDHEKKAEVCGNPEERCAKLLAALKMKQRVLHRHHTALRATMDHLAMLYAELGDYSKSVEMIKQCIPSLEYQFGSHSMEVAHELCKLADVMSERLLSSPLHPDAREWSLETQKVTWKALQLVELNYGAWEARHARLRERAARVARALPPTALPTSVHDTLHYNLKI